MILFNQKCLTYLIVCNKAPLKLMAGMIWDIRQCHLPSRKIFVSFPPMHFVSLVLNWALKTKISGVPQKTPQSQRQSYADRFVHPHPEGVCPSEVFVLLWQTPWPKAHWGREGSTSLPVHHEGQSEWDRGCRNWTRDHRGTLHTGFLFMVCSVCFVTYMPRDSIA